jgi:hypothetical protein
MQWHTHMVFNSWALHTWRTQKSIIYELNYNANVATLSTKASQADTQPNSLRCHVFVETCALFLARWEGGEGST